MKKSKFYSLIIIVILISACGGLSQKQRTSPEEAIKAQKQRTSAEEAIKALKKLDAATDVGINRSEYNKMLIDAQTLVNQASENLPDGDLKQEIKLTMEGYLDANNLWNNTKSTFFCENPPKDWLQKAMCNPEVKHLRNKYQIPVYSSEGKIQEKPDVGTVRKSEGLSIIWRSAKEHLNRASSLFNEM